MAEPNVSRSRTRNSDGSEAESQASNQFNTEAPQVDPDTASGSDVAVEPTDYTDAPKLTEDFFKGEHWLEVSAYDQYAAINGTASTGSFQSPFPEGWEHLGTATAIFKLTFSKDPEKEDSGRKSLDQIEEDYKPLLEENDSTSEK